MTTSVEPPGVRIGHLPGTPSGGGLPGALAAEWTKLWSLRSTWWGLFGAGLLMGLVSMIMAEATVANNKDPGPEGPPGVVSVGDIATGAVETVQFVVLAIALLMVTGEYATGSIRATLQWVPPRGRMLWSKAAVAVAVVFPTAVLLTLIGSVVAWFWLDEWGRVDAGDLVHDALTIGLYLSLMSVLVMGVGAMLRSTAATLTTAFIFVLVLPITLVNTGSELLKDVADGLPSSAGRHMMNGDGPYPTVVALAILAAWTAAAAWGGITVLRRRDA
ncbi:ABC transporter permease [Actinomadura spongiicola]|uniref:ABC transporter permease n=1 Tax=Actinomadura spongiicola TaxID=2303421 RepID=A0A372G6V8_9ACTN|nr:ABC transporter permease [Actinomadura spongiicola]RFS81037.1 ABC transporter permease [Actinomadura spongiicola]